MNKEIWQPTASLTNLRVRAQVLKKIREFFVARNVLEVETPLLCAATVTDPHLHSLTTQLHIPGDQQSQLLYLQTSPEFAMKRLLAAGSGAIYTLGKAFRDQEQGQQHNPEFTLLEWYQPDYDHQQLMTEVDELLQVVLATPTAQRMTYSDVFLYYCDIEPHSASIEMLQTCATACGIEEIVGVDVNDRNTWLELIMSHVIEPQLGYEKPLFIYDYPVTQAALAKIREDNPPVAERFEVYVQGKELANGFHELTDPDEQQRRFVKDLAYRRQHGLPEVKHDNKLIAALQAGLPACAGVALGIDRLVMLACQTHVIDEVISFAINNA